MASRPQGASKKLYSFSDHPEHKAQLEPWAKRWIANAMSTKPMDDADRAACVEAVHGLYAAANLPPPKHIVFVPSPFVLAFAGMTVRRAAPLSSEVMSSSSAEGRVGNQATDEQLTPEAPNV